MTGDESTAFLDNKKSINKASFAKYLEEEHKIEQKEAHEIYDDEYDDSMDDFTGKFLIGGQTAEEIENLLLNDNQFQDDEGEDGETQVMHKIVNLKRKPTPMSILKGNNPNRRFNPTDAAFVPSSLKSTDKSNTLSQNVKPTGTPGGNEEKSPKDDEGQSQDSSIRGRGRGRGGPRGRGDQQNHHRKDKSLKKRGGYLQ